MSDIVNQALHNYYDSFESRIGYRLLLGGTRHFGFYEAGTYWPFPISTALRAMENQILESLGQDTGATLLDAGCGVGHVAIHLAQKGYRIQGIDVTDHHLVDARRNVVTHGLTSKVSIRKGDYHDLSDLEDSTFDGIYTMETFVHATSSETAAREFFRVLKPGGALAMFEYDHIDFSAAPEEASRSWRFVNHHAAMPASSRFRQGVLQDILRDAGFENIETKDFSDNVLPMLRLFYFLAIVPYFIVSVLGVKHKFVNTVAAYEGYVYRDFVRYIAVSATKPGGSK